MPTDSYQKDLANLIKGVALKASKQLYSRDYEDIEQDLWVKVLEAEKRKGHQLDLNLVGKICWDYVKDMIDYDQRRNHYSTDFSGTGNDENTEFADTNFIGAKADTGEYEPEITLKDLYSQFPEGSKERIYLDFYGNLSGAMPNTRVVPETNRNNDGFSENNLAKMLGFSNSSSSGYKKFRDKMKSIISDYYNLK